MEIICKVIETIVILIAGGLLAALGWGIILKGAGLFDTDDSTE